MALRRRIAERIGRPLKRVGIQTPILEEVPLRAERISTLELIFPTVRGVIPVIERGKAYGEVAGRWYHVLFLRAIQAPSVVAIGEARRGEIPTVVAPKISIPKVKVPTVAIPKIKDVVIPDVNIPFINLSFPYYATDISVLRELVDSLNKMTKMLYSLQSRVNDGIHWINTAFDKFTETFEATKDSLADLRGKVQVGFNEYRANIQTAFNLDVANVQSSVNAGLAKLLPALYDAWGVPRTMALTPLHVRNITSTGFEFQSYAKTTCYWLAVGRRF